MLNLEDLNLNGLKIYQDDELYRFTSDSVLLSRFATAKKGDIVADFCSGSGIVGIHFYGLNQDKVKNVTLFEMQKPLFDLSVKNVEYNHLNDIFTPVNCKVQDIDKVYNERFSLILCNPPYMSVDGGMHDKDQSIAMCKREVTLPLTELISNISRCLKFGGRTCICHRADRLADIICTMREFNLEPKRLQTVQNGNKPPYLIMIEGVKGGKSSLKILPPQEN